MITLSLALALAVAQPAPGEVELTIDGVTTTHAVADCAIEAEDAMPARLQVQDMDVTLTVAKADHMQTLSVLRNNQNWTASRMSIGGNWMDQGEPGEPIILQWGETIRIEAVLTSGQAAGEKHVTLTARCY